MIRLLLVALFLITFLILSIPIFFIEWLIGKKNPALRDISSLRIVQWAFKVILWLSGCRLTVIGEENVPKDEAVLYIGNHRGFFDIVATYARCPRLTGYMAKKEIERVPLLSVWMRLLHCLFLDRASNISKTEFLSVYFLKAPAAPDLIRRNSYLSVRARLRSPPRPTARSSPSP